MKIKLLRSDGLAIALAAALAFTAVGGGIGAELSVSPSVDGEVADLNLGYEAGAALVEASGGSDGAADTLGKVTGFAGGVAGFSGGAYGGGAAAAAIVGSGTVLAAPFAVAGAAAGMGVAAY
jgi:hypothetical protein